VVSLSIVSFADSQTFPLGLAAGDVIVDEAHVISASDADSIRSTSNALLADTGFPLVVVTIRRSGKTGWGWALLAGARRNVRIVGRGPRAHRFHSCRGCFFRAPGTRCCFFSSCSSASSSSFSFSGNRSTHVTQIDPAQSIVLESGFHQPDMYSSTRSPQGAVVSLHDLLGGALCEEVL
jgi:hypothetical protein